MLWGQPLPTFYMPEESLPNRSRNPRRHRRSAGRTAGSAWGKGLGISLAALLGLTVVAYFGFGVWLKGFLRSEAFQNQLNDQLASKLKAKTQFDDLTWGDNAVQLAKLTSTGYADALFAKTTVEDVRAEVKLSLWDRKVEVPSITVSRVNMLISDEGKLPGPFPQAETTPLTSPPAGRRWLENLRPNQLVLADIRIDEFSAIVKSSAGEVRLNSLPLLVKSGQNYETWSVESHPTSERAQLVTNLGEGLRIKLKDLRARLRPEQFDLIQMEGTVEKLRPSGKAAADLSPARLSLTGNLHPPSQADFEAHLTELKLEDWVAPDWIQRLTGTADLQAHLAGDPSHPATLRLDGDLTVKHGVLTSLPLLENLAERTHAREFTRLELNTAQWHFTHQGNLWQIDQIQIESRGLIRLEGTVTLTGNEVTGVIEVGVAPGRLRAIDGAEQRVFTREENGYKWATPAMHLSGTLDNISEDLGRRIKDAWLDQQLQNVTELAVKAPEALLQHSDQAVELGSKVLEATSKAAPNVIETGVQLFQGLLGK